MVLVWIGEIGLWLVFGSVVVCVWWWCGVIWFLVRVVGLWNKLIGVFVGGVS